MFVCRFTLSSLVFSSMYEWMRRWTRLGRIFPPFTSSVTPFLHVPRQRYASHTQHITWCHLHCSPSPNPQLLPPLHASIYLSPTPLPAPLPAPLPSHNAHTHHLTQIQNKIMQQPLAHLYFLTVFEDLLTSKFGLPNLIRTSQKIKNVSYYQYRYFLTTSLTSYLSLSFCACACVCVDMCGQLHARGTAAVVACGAAGHGASAHQGGSHPP